jgi:hypothetical protein
MVVVVAVVMVMVMVMVMVEVVARWYKGTGERVTLFGLSSLSHTHIQLLQAQ